MTVEKYNTETSAVTDKLVQSGRLQQFGRRQGARRGPLSSWAKGKNFIQTDSEVSDPGSSGNAAKE